MTEEVVRRLVRDAVTTYGLRTLCVAKRELGAAEYAGWAARYREASLAVRDRKGRMEALADEVERGLALLGATAIEDKLQDGVPEILKDLRAAGIKVWMLTGDKLETARGIAQNASLVPRGKGFHTVSVRSAAEARHQLNTVQS